MNLSPIWSEEFDRLLARAPYFSTQYEAWRWLSNYMYLIYGKAQMIELAERLYRSQNVDGV